MPIAMKTRTTSGSARNKESGLAEINLSLLVKTSDIENVANALDGFISLIKPFNPKTARTAGVKIPKIWETRFRRKSHEIKVITSEGEQVLEVSKILTTSVPLSSENPKAEKAPSKAKPPRLDEDGEKMLSIEEAFPNMHPGSILRGFRFRDEMTQQDLADKLKINQSRVSELENGSRAITKTMAARLAKLFGTSYRVFL